jgi:hypothetical protein
MIVSPRRCFFAMIVSPTRPVFASPRHTVCKPLHLSVGSVAIASGKCLLLPGDHLIPDNLTMPVLRKALANQTDTD